jgi:tetratricopeptide (TPR) repeat protein
MNELKKKSETDLPKAQNANNSHTTASTATTSSGKKKSRPKSAMFNGVHYAFPILIAILLWYLLSQIIFKQFGPKANSNINQKRKNKQYENSKNDLIVRVDTNEMSIIDEELAVQSFRIHFTEAELKFKEKIVNVERLIELNELNQATQELKELGHFLLPDSPRFIYASALLIDRISIFEKNNSKLKACIEIYKKLFNLNNVDSNLLFIAGRRLVNRLLFLGRPFEALKYNELLVKKIPNNIHLINDFGICYLMVNKPTLAKQQFHKVFILTNYNNIVAQCHYAFILKTYEKKFSESIEHFNKCLSANNKDTMDARFFYHAGDALQRLNRTKEVIFYFLFF